MRGNATRGKRILVVDDDQTAQDLLNELLCRDGHVVAQAQDGFKALELFSPGKFDLVIIDLLMPGMRGDELATKIKELSPSQSVLLISGLASDLPGAEEPFNRILRKPFTISELQAAMAELLS